MPTIASLPETRQLVVTAALNDLFTKQWFDMCNLNKVREIVNAPRNSEAYKLLDALHCVAYDKMPPDLRNRIPQLVNEVLRPPIVVDPAVGVALEGVHV